MLTLKVLTAAGGAYIIKDATAFGPDAVIGRTDDNRELRIFRFADTDLVEKI